MPEDFRFVRYENEQIENDGAVASDDDVIYTYEQLCEQYSQEQQQMTKFLEPVWSSFLMTFHMPWLFKLLFFPLMWIYFRFINRAKGKQWASRITDPLYVSLPLIRTVWNLSGLPIIVWAIRYRFPLGTCHRFDVPTQWVLNSAKKPENWPASVPCFLYAKTKIPENSSDTIEVPAVVLHIHGGGFIACSPQGHEMYTRRWAQLSGLPIVSVDYSLAPEFPFPTAFNQCASVYQLLLSDEGKKTLGLNYEKVIITGDSAGGNMATAITLWALTEGIPVPQGVVLTYPSLNRTPTFSTVSAVLKKNDMMIPQSFRNCYKMAYISSVWDKESKTFQFADERSKEYYLTPLSAPEAILQDFPPCYMICGTHDPLWCDTAIFYNKLVKHSKNRVVCDAIADVTHGFLAADSKMPHTSTFAIENTANWFTVFSNIH